MPRRIAFVVNASTGAELSGGSQDAARMYTLLTRGDLGRCEPTSPPPLHQCRDRETFNNALMACLKDWHREDQLIFYYSGHGAVVNGKYVLRFGEDSVLPFENVMTDLQVHGVVRAIVILDACQSGEVLSRGRKSGDVDMPPREAFPRGIALVTSCREREASYELLDGSASVFTSLLASGIETGLDGRQTDDGHITVQDAIEYINAKMETEEYATYPQTPAYGIHEADRSIWLAHNITPERKKAADTPHSLHTLEELRLLYENTAPNSRPCPGCTIEDLDWGLVERFAERSEMLLPADKGAAVRELGLLSYIAPQQFTRAAVLCFARHPHRFVPQARTVFVTGSMVGGGLDRKDVLGPLSVQLGKLVDLVTRYAERYVQVGLEKTQYMLAVREALSNAIAHRDYSLPGHVQVRLEFPTIRVLSPGALPEGLTWQELMASEASSSPTDPAIAWYLTLLQAAETIGRGFEVYRSYQHSAGPDTLFGKESADRRQVTVSVTYVPEDTPSDPSEYTQLFATPSSASTPATAAPSGAQDGDAGPPLPPPSSPVGLPPARSTPTPTPSTTKLPPGHPTELAGLQIISVLGEGGSGAVYLAHEPELDRNVAVKTLFQRFGSSTQRERFLREARSAARLSHPGIVPVYRIGDEGDYYYIVMRYVEGRTLKEIIAEEAPLADRRAARLTRQMALALSAAHSAGVIHRDMKPGNVIVDESGTPVITDFGIAQVGPTDVSLTATGYVLGTPAYMSPEQIEGHHLDPGTDIYALGVMLYEMLMGRNPNDGMSILEILEHRRAGPPPTLEREPPIDDDLVAICRRALEPARSARFESATEMADAIERWELGD